MEGVSVIMKANHTEWLIMYEDKICVNCNKSMLFIIH